MDPLLSVIVPVFNTGILLKKCLDSILSQTYSNLEIIIVDDQSTDNTPEIIAAYEGSNDNIRSFQTPARSLAGGARNIGINNARGEYISFVDSDDWIDTGLFKKTIGFMLAQNVDIGVFGVVKEYESKYEAFNKYTYSDDNVIEGKLALNVLTNTINQDFQLSPIACNKLYKTDFLTLNKIQFLSDSFNEDDAFNFLSFLRVDKVALISGPSYHYYQRNSSITHFFSKKHIDDLLYCFQFIAKELTKTDSFELYAKNYFAYFERCLGFVLNLLITHEPNIQKQNEYLKYLFDRAKYPIAVEDLLIYCGASRLRFFFNPHTIK